MPILRLNSAPAGLELHGSPASAASAIASAARGTGPVMILIHGYKYDPGCAPFSPHTTIFARTRHPDTSTHMQWLPHLGFGTGDRNEGLAIAFGWRARGDIWRARRSARVAGQHLADVITRIRARAPHRPIHAITHSMGSEVVFEALQALPAHAVARIVTITGASYASRAVQAMTSPAGRTAALINITSRENDVFDFMFERLIAPPVPGDRAMGAGVVLPNAVTLQLDCPRTLATLIRFGGQIAPPARRVCHWSGYTRLGALRFYSQCLRHPEMTPLHLLHHALPQRHAPRWSRVFARPRIAWPLPLDGKHAS